MRIRLGGHKSVEFFRLVSKERDFLGEFSKRRNWNFFDEFILGDICISEYFREAE